MRVTSDIAVAAPVEDVWSIVTDPERVLSYMSGVTRWEVASDLPAGLGARYRMLFRVGAAEVGGLIEVVEFAEPFEFAWTSITGLDQRGRWRLRELPGGRTRVELRLAYGIAGAGLSGWLAERIAAPSVSRHVRQTLQQLGRIVEHEQLRSRAAERARRRPLGAPAPAPHAGTRSARRHPLGTPAPARHAGTCTTCQSPQEPMTAAVDACGACAV